jgi:hypothetical protein
MIMMNGVDSHVDIQCWKCQQFYTIMYNRDDMTAWLGGSGFIQDIMGYLTDGERELLISGTCSRCFDSLFSTIDTDD